MKIEDVQIILTKFSIKKDFFRQRNEVLSCANEDVVKIILTFVALPNYKWMQQNNPVQYRRLFEDFKYQDAAIKFWKDIAHELKTIKQL